MIDYFYNLSNPMPFNACIFVYFFSCKRCGFMNNNTPGLNITNLVRLIMRQCSFVWKCNIARYLIHFENRDGKNNG